MGGACPRGGVIWAQEGLDSPPCEEGEHPSSPFTLELLTLVPTDGNIPNSTRSRSLLSPPGRGTGEAGGWRKAFIRSYKNRSSAINTPINKHLQ